MITLRDYLDFEMTKKVVVKSIGNASRKYIKEGTILYNSLLTPIKRDDMYYFFEAEKNQMIGIPEKYLDQILIELAK